MYVCMYVPIYASIDINFISSYLTNTLRIIQSFAYVFAQLFHFWPLEALSVGFHIPLTHFHPLVWPLSYFLALQDAWGSSCIFAALVLQSVISPRSIGSSYWTVSSEIKIRHWIHIAFFFLYPRKFQNIHFKTMN